MISFLSSLIKRGNPYMSPIGKTDKSCCPLSGAFLPPAQDALELKYKEELMTVFGIEFNQLFTMTNMPIKRFADFLHRR